MTEVIRKLIRADGTSEDLAEGARGSTVKIAELIGADCLDTVRLRDRQHVMLVDDAGHEKRLPVNAEATRQYHEVCLPGTTHTIRGDVVVVPDKDFA